MFKNFVIVCWLNASWLIHTTRTQYAVGMHRQLFSSFVETTGKQKYEFQVEVAHTRHVLVL